MQLKFYGIEYLLNIYRLKKTHALPDLARNNLKIILELSRREDLDFDVERLERNQLSWTTYQIPSAQSMLGPNVLESSD